MYAPDSDMRIAPDTDPERLAKQALTSAFDRLNQVSDAERPAIVAEIGRLETLLNEELKRTIRDYE
jgi:hypothetical protein